MTEILTQDEIDQLLTAIGAGDSVVAFESLEVFEQYLTRRKFTPEKPYGMFERDISICRFFDSGGSENILADIKQKNEEQGFGNIKIPNTEITLLNYSFCQRCNTIFSFKEITEYYMNPAPDPRFKLRALQYRRDTRVRCHTCGAFFLPSLIISDGTPRNEIQLLCRTQTIDAVEQFFAVKSMRVLTKNPHNIVQRDGLRAIKNDVYLKNLEEKPALMTNIIQYTPIYGIMNLIDGTNVAKGDLLFA